MSVLKVLTAPGEPQKVHPESFFISRATDSCRYSSPPANGANRLASQTGLDQDFFNCKHYISFSLSKSCQCITQKQTYSAHLLRVETPSGQHK